jgi:hypothetical protein
MIDAHPVLEIRPYYPTQDACDAACKALEKHRQRADKAEADLAALDASGGIPPTGLPGDFNPHWPPLRGDQ